MMALELSNPVHLALKDDITQGKMDRVAGPRCQGGDIVVYHYGSAEGKTTDVKVWSIVISGLFCCFCLHLVQIQVLVRAI